MPAQPFSVDYDAASGLATLRPHDGGTVLIERVNPTEIVFRVRAADDARSEEAGAALPFAAGTVPIPPSPDASSAPSSPRIGSPCTATSPQAAAAPVSRRSSVNGDTVASSPEGDPVDRGKASISAEQLTAAQQAVQRAIRGLSHDASKPKARCFIITHTFSQALPSDVASSDWSTEHPCDETREQCGLPRPPGLGGDLGSASEASSHGGRGSSARHRGAGVDGVGMFNNGGAAHQNGVGVPPEELNRASTHPAVSPQSTVKTRSAPRRASGAGSDGGGGLGEPQLRQGPLNPLRQRSLGWPGEAAHADGPVSELRRGSLPDIGGGSYSSGGAPVVQRTSWHGQQQQVAQQALSQMLARGALPPPPPPSQHQPVQRLAGLAGTPPPPPPRVQSPHARVAQTLNQANGSLQREPMVPFGSPALRSRLAYGSSVGTQSPDHTSPGGLMFLPQDGAYGDVPLDLLVQAKQGLDAETAEGQVALQARLRAGAAAAQRPITHEQFEFWSEQNAVNGLQETALINSFALASDQQSAGALSPAGAAQSNGVLTTDGRLNLRTDSWPPPMEAFAPQRLQQPFSPAVRQSFQYSFLGTSDSAADLMRQFGADQGQPREPPEPPPGAPVFRPPVVASDGLGGGLSPLGRPSSIALSAPLGAGGGARSVAGQRPPAWPWDRHSDIAWHGEAAACGDGDAASVHTPISLHSPRYQHTDTSMGDQGFMHHVASSYASSVTGASAYDDALAAVAAAEARSPSTDRHRTPLQDALAHLGTAEGGGGMQQGRALFGEAASPTALPSVATGSPPEHAPRPASGGWRPMDAEAERESRVAAIRAEFRAVAQSVVGSPRPKRWNASSARSSLASEQTGVEPGGPNELPKFPLPEMFGFLDEDG